MSRPWRAGGDGRSVSFPELPWKKENPAVEHETEVHVSAQAENFPRRLFYFACSCGACGPMQATPEQAGADADGHHEWVRRNSQ